jgi:hypothetical protein
MFLKLCSALLFVAACVCLYFGSGWLLILPRFPGESYFTPERLMSGVGLSTLGIVLLFGCGWAWSRLSRLTPASIAMRKVFSLAAGVVALFWLTLMIIGGIRQG